MLTRSQPRPAVSRRSSPSVAPSSAGEKKVPTAPELPALHPAEQVVRFNPRRADLGRWFQHLPRRPSSRTAWSLRGGAGLPLNRFPGLPSSHAPILCHRVGRGPLVAKSPNTSANCPSVPPICAPPPFRSARPPVGFSPQVRELTEQTRTSIPLSETVHRSPWPALLGRPRVPVPRSRTARRSPTDTPSRSNKLPRSSLNRFRAALCRPASHPPGPSALGGRRSPSLCAEPGRLVAGRLLVQTTWRLGGRGCDSPVRPRASTPASNAVLPISTTSRRRRLGPSAKARKTSVPARPSRSDALAAIAINARLARRGSEPP